MNDTKKAIEQFTAIINSKEEEIQIYKSAIAILSGTFETQAIELENKYKQTIEDLKKLVPESPVVVEPQKEVSATPLTDDKSVEVSVDTTPVETNNIIN
jgi:hypothetical protein